MFRMVSYTSSVLHISYQFHIMHSHNVYARMSRLKWQSSRASCQVDGSMPGDPQGLGKEQPKPGDVMFGWDNTYEHEQKPIIYICPYTVSRYRYTCTYAQAYAYAYTNTFIYIYIHIHNMNIMWMWNSVSIQWYTNRSAPEPDPRPSQMRGMRHGFFLQRREGQVAAGHVAGSIGRMQLQQDGRVPLGSGWDPCEFLDKTLSLQKNHRTIHQQWVAYRYQKEGKRFGIWSDCMLRHFLRLLLSSKVHA